MKPCTRNTHTGSSLFKMKTLLFIVFLSCSVSVGEGTAAPDCDNCTATWNSTADCAKINTYISCLIDTYEVDKTKAGCDKVKDKMDTATSSYDKNCEENPGRDTCLCEVAYYQSALDCTAIKTKLTCLFDKTNAGCNEAKTKLNLVKAAKTIGEASDKCLTDTCLCEASYEETDVSSPELKCTALKMKIHCLVNADDLACDGKTKRSEVATETEKLIVDEADPAMRRKKRAVVKCKSDLTETCKCAITYTMTSTANQTEKCTAAQDAQNCLNFTTSDTACDGTTGTQQYLSGTIIPIVTQACSGTGIMLSASVAAGYLLILFQMFLE